MHRRSEDGSVEPSAAAELKLIIKPLGEVSFGGSMPGNRAAELLRLMTLVLLMLGPPTTLAIGSAVGAAPWTCLILAAAQIAAALFIGRSSQRAPELNRRRARIQTQQD